MKRNLILSFVVILAVTFVAQMAYARTTTNTALDQTEDQDALSAEQQQTLPPSEQLTPQQIQQIQLRRKRKKQLEERKKQQEAAKAAAAAAAPVVDDSPIKFSADVSLAYETKTSPDSNGITTNGSVIDMYPQVQIYDFSLKGYFEYSYNFNQPGINSGWSDGLISLLYDGWEAGVVKFSPYTSVELPLSTESLENRQIKYVNNLGVLTALDTKALDIPEWSLSYSIAYGHYTNEYTTRVNGDPATDYKIVQTLKTGYNWDPVSVHFKFQLTSAYSYDDVVTTKFLHVESISYAITPAFGFSLYHYNAAPLLNSTTYQNNLKVFDPDSSTLGVSLDFSI